jgi:hypothetical protein
VKTVVAQYRSLATFLGKEKQNMTNEQFAEVNTAAKGLFKTFCMEIIDIWSDEKERKFTVWCRSHCETVISDDYSNEYWFGFYFDEEGEKIIKFLEFVDTKYSHEFMMALGRAGKLVNGPSTEDVKKAVAQEKLAEKV